MKNIRHPDTPPLIACVPTQAQVSLDSVVTLSQHTLTLKAVLEELDIQSNYTFSYSNRVPLQATITFPERSGSLRYFLDRICQEQSVQYRVIKDKILVVREKDIGALLQEVTLSGYLTDAATGEKLMDATIYNQESGTSTTTNAYGYYALSMPPGEHTLTYSFLGYQAQLLTLPVEESRTLNVELSTSEVELDEVIVTAQ